jgi:NAD(P)-dependent dehydrogenase (short-subunit alcohol dehydrogenase family)
MTNVFSDLKGKIALVTGATRGLGRQIAEALAREGATIVVVSRNSADCEAAAKEIAAHGVEAYALPGDVGDWNRCAELVDGAYAKFGRVDVLVNNAGMSPVLRKLTDLDEASFDAIFDVNVKSVYRLSTLIGERMAAGEGGSIINISSTAAALASAPVAPYAAAKGAVNVLSKALARFYGPKVRVNTIMCGTFRTDLTAGFVDHPGFVKHVQSANPAKRVGDPPEIAAAALYLASAASSYTSGAILTVDGGEA